MTPEDLKNAILVGADEMADRIEVLENKIAKAVWVLRSMRDIDGELYKVVADLEGK